MIWWVIYVYSLGIIYHNEWCKCIVYMTFWMLSIYRGVSWTFSWCYGVTVIGWVVENVFGLEPPSNWHSESNKWYPGEHNCSCKLISELLSWHFNSHVCYSWAANVIKWSKWQLSANHSANIIMKQQLYCLIYFNTLAFKKKRKFVLEADIFF